MLLKDTDDLLFGKFGSFHLWSSLGQSLLQTGLGAGGNVRACIDGVRYKLKHNSARVTAGRNPTREMGAPLSDHEEFVGATDRLITDPDFRDLETAFSSFCPFEAMGMVRAEIRHSNFLAYILNPYRPHGFGKAILEAFLGGVLPDAPEVASELMDAEIRREWRNIDLLILLPKAKRTIAIELKIDARQGANQLGRYRHIVEAYWPQSAGWKHDFVFLTKNAEAPNDDAWASYRLHDLVKQLDRVAASPSLENAQGRNTLCAYIRMLRRHHLGDEAMEQMAQRLWAKHGEALEFLAARRPDPLRAVFESFRESLDEFIADCAAAGVTLIADDHSNGILRFAVASWDNLPGFRTSDWTSTKRLILLEFKIENTKITGNLYIGPGPDRDPYIQALLQKEQRRTRGGALIKWFNLAREELVTLDDVSEMDHDEALGQCSARMRDFTKHTVDRFSTKLRTLSLQGTATAGGTTIG